MTQPMLGRRALATLALALAAPAAAAQPLNRPVRVLVGFPPGGPTDLVARLYAERLRPAYAPAALVENRAGASGRLAVEAVRAAEPDGATLLVTPASVMVLQPHIFPREVRFDALTDFVPVCSLCDFGMGIAVPAGHPAQDFGEFATWLRAQGAEVSYGSPAAGSGPHFLGDMTARALGGRVTHVPYRGAAPAVQDALGGRIPMVVTVISDVAPHHGRGLRVIAVSTRERVASLPQVPTLAELGFAQLTLTEWMGLFAPARTPAALVAALHEAVAAAVRMPELRGALERLEFLPVVEGPEAFARRVAADRAAWGPIVAASGFEVER